MEHQYQILTTSNVVDTFVPEKIMYFYNAMQNSYVTKGNWKLRSEIELWNELCFCILSGNVLYDLAKSVVVVMREKNLLDPLWIIKTSKAGSLIRSELAKPNFEPRRLNGELRKYRYPKKRAYQIAQAARILYSNGKSIQTVLSESKTDIDARNFFADKIPGLGIKEASHFLRNIGYSDSLAIIDIHMLSFLKSYAFLDLRKGIHLNKKMYLRIESLLRNYVKYHCLNLAIFDLAVWHYMRSNG